MWKYQKENGWPKPLRSVSVLSLREIIQRLLDKKMIEYKHLLLFLLQSY